MIQIEQLTKYLDSQKELIRQSDELTEKLTGIREKMNDIVSGIDSVKMWDRKKKSRRIKALSNAAEDIEEKLRACEEAEGCLAMLFSRLSDTRSMQILDRYYICGQSEGAISAEMGCSRAAVSKAKKNGVGELAQVLTEDDLKSIKNNV